MNVLDRTEELLHKLLDEHPPEMILSALDKMARMQKEELIVPGKLCEIINRAEAAEVEKAKIHQPDYWKVVRR